MTTERAARAGASRVSGSRAVPAARADDRARRGRVLRVTGVDVLGAARPVGVVVMAMGALVAACAGIGAALDALQPRERPDHPVLGVVGAALAALAAGSLLVRLGRRAPASGITSRRQATLAVVAIWAAATLVGALPFVWGADMSLDAAVFEAASGLTTTGATALADIEQRLSRGLLLWRSLIQWLGGMGIVVLFVAVFPSVGVGAKHMFQGEVPGATADALTPRIRDTSFALWKIYGALTLILALLLSALGMDPFEAVCHALTTLSTGGFSTRDASIAAFDSPAIETTIAVFMYLASLNFALFFAALRTRSVRGLLRNVELRTFAAVAALSVVLVTLATTSLYGGSVPQALRYAFFTVATFMSSTGFTSADHALYPPPVLGLVLLLMLMGGCSGSTAGGLKVERVILLVKQAGSQLRRSFRPNVVDVVRLGRQVVEPGVLADVGAVFFLYLATLAVGVVALSLTEGFGLGTAVGAMITSLSNMGPAPYYQGADNFADYSAAGKMVCAAAMLLGRLEFFTVLALLVPTFWRR